MDVWIGCVPCSRAAELGFTPYKGSTKARCSRCGAEVWLGPEQKKQREAHAYPIICLVCAVKELGPQGAMASLHKLTSKRFGE